jgi:ubiquinone/menaquinone biosynthesis C-methylase UbiE
MPHGWTKDYNHAERLLWQDPVRILSDIGLKEGDTFIDIGCGDGFFSIPAARMVGNRGLIYAIDASEEAIGSLNQKAGEFNNIRTLVAEAEQSVLCEHCADVVMMANVLHDFLDPAAVLSNSRQMLKFEGILADLDWKKEPQQIHGPLLSKRLNEEEAASLLYVQGFSVFSRSLSGPYHYLLLARPSRSAV